MNGLCNQGDASCFSTICLDLSRGPRYQKPVLVIVYIFLDFDHTSYVTVSCRIYEADTWKPDLEKVIYTIDFE